MFISRKARKDPPKEMDNKKNFSYDLGWNFLEVKKLKFFFSKDFCKNSKSLMNSEIYTRILEQALLPFIKNKYDCDDFEFLQDNAPIHKSKLSMNWFKENSIKLVSFPTKSPDLNPIEKDME
ncbi:hypothetical protein M0812_24389 [Anaeramoeba flamelloides]|uniref:Tc1-like transposase DDE domain-containing protein n=1 Tax=Anaeramoeba flamelloides TaxID=1746091 RepID=A0AAV7YJC4_9EUKA|nr:hypothetical protein M0812_24389 [Anaeramoeba flamelloides]